MAEITIECRSPFQRMILDTLWQFDTYQQCLEFRDTLPNQAQRDICTAMLDMLVAAQFDQCVQTEEDCEIARDYLSSY